MEHKFYVEMPQTTRTDVYKTLDDDVITLTTIQSGNGGSMAITSEKEGGIPSANINLIKLVPIGENSKYIQPISKYDQLKSSIEYGFFCLEYNGQIYQSDFGNYGAPPEWATHFTHIDLNQYGWMA